MKQNSTIRKFLAPARRTPFHPQWYALKNSRQCLSEIRRIPPGTILDIGSGSRKVENSLPPGSNYISIDYLMTATKWYNSQPHIFGDGQLLPIRSNSVDTVLLLDVLEHIENPKKAIAEIERVLRPEGRLIIQVPFMYPLHDEPFDFQRWTIHGLRVLAKTNNFIVERERTSGTPLETAALLANLAISKSVLNWFRKRNFLIIFFPLFVLLIPVINIFAWILTIVSRTKDDFMPHSYLSVWEKPS